MELEHETVYSVGSNAYNHQECVVYVLSQGKSSQWRIGPSVNDRSRLEKSARVENWIELTVTQQKKPFNYAEFDANHRTARVVAYVSLPWLAYGPA